MSYLITFLIMLLISLIGGIVLHEFLVEIMGFKNQSLFYRKPRTETIEANNKHTSTEKASFVRDSSFSRIFKK